MSAKPPRPIHVSRAELMTLLYDKLGLIQSEIEEAQAAGEHGYSGRRLSDLKKRLTRIAVEAKRSQSLIDSYEAHWMEGRCMHCDRPFSEHSEYGLKPELGAGPRVRVKSDNDDEARPAYCGMRIDKYESLELATYQNLPESAGEG